MFENLTDRISRTLRNISNRGRLTENNIKETLREVRMVLLEADVALPVIREFIQSVKETAIGKDINKSLTPGQEFIKIVHNKLIKVMGFENSTLNLDMQYPAIILIVGLQGSGKSTTVAKLGKLLKKTQNKKVLVVSTDVYRPAAIKQLEILTQTVGVNFFPSTANEKPIVIATNALQYAKIKFYDVLIIDTAGRIHINKTMMTEIQAIYRVLNPIETLLIVDAMTGQDAANITKSFDKTLPLTGVILTKMDGDARGGAALSIRHISGKPIKFLGIGEKINDLEPFYPERIASRILGMGDFLSLIEEIESKIDRKKVERLTYKLKKNNSFNLNDFLEQIKQIRNIGGITRMLNKIPGISKVPDTIQSQIDDRVLLRMEAIISSMTIEEQQNPKIINGSRKRRIAVGSGTQIQDVNKLLKQFSNMQHIVKKIKKNGLKKMINEIKSIMPPSFPKT